MLEKCLPPEAYSECGRRVDVDGAKFDMWCLGILMLECLTGSYLERKLSKPIKSWASDVYPVLYKALNKQKFKKLVSKQYPKDKKKISINKLRKLIASILRYNPNKRPSARMVYEMMMTINHWNQFLADPVMDEIWKKKTVSFNGLRKKVQESFFVKEFAEIKTEKVETMQDVLRPNLRSISECDIEVSPEIIMKHDEKSQEIITFNRENKHDDQTSNDERNQMESGDYATVNAADVSKKDDYWAKNSLENGMRASASDLGQNEGHSRAVSEEQVNTQHLIFKSEETVVKTVIDNNATTVHFDEKEDEETPNVLRECNPVETKQSFFNGKNIVLEVCLVLGFIGLLISTFIMD